MNSSAAHFPQTWIMLEATVHKALVILSAAKDLGGPGDFVPDPSLRSG
jgi:hypothetical protein